ncbi:unnamed protein product [Camellia sinensis]
MSHRTLRLRRQSNLCSAEKSISTRRRSHSLGSAMAAEGFGRDSEPNYYLGSTEARCVGPGQWSIGSGWEETRWVGVFGFGLDPELSFGITFRRIGCRTGKSWKYLFSQFGYIMPHIYRAFSRIFTKWEASKFFRISQNFRNARQEDAHEYMVNLLESMHKCCLPAGTPSESPSAYVKSLVHKIFGGRLRSQVKCMQCSFCSNKFDPFLDLSLEINKAESLHKALIHFTAKEYLDGGEGQYQCQRCKQNVKALKQPSIHKAPYVLAIHLKRFGTYQPGQKIDKKVLFGPTLDLKPFVTAPYGKQCDIGIWNMYWDGDLKYTLYGVLVHAGWSTHSGHYYCFVRTSSGMWYSLDDHQGFNHHAFGSNLGTKPNLTVIRQSESHGSRGNLEGNI